MLNFLFRGLTGDPPRGAELFATVTAEARQPHWYVEGGVPDTLDGRFAMLSTIAALVLVRLEQLGEGGNAMSVALTERFIEVMEAEHRELGFGDPGLGKKVRRLVSALARRTELWRSAVTGERDWPAIVAVGVYDGDASADALRHTSEALKRIWARLERGEVAAIAAGRLG